MKKIFILFFIFSLFISLIACMASCDDGKVCLNCDDTLECGLCGGDGKRVCPMLYQYWSGIAGPHDPSTCTECDDQGSAWCNGCSGTGVCTQCYLYK